MRRIFAAATLLFAGTLSGAGAEAASAPGPAAAPSIADPPAVWDLTPLYPTGAAWEAERRAIAATLPDIANLRGTLTNSASLLAALDRISAVRRRLARLETYASLNSDVDTRVAANQVLRQQAEDLDTRLAQATAFLGPEVIALGRTRIEGYIGRTPGLAKHRYRLETILRQAPHTLGAEAEGVLAAAQTPLAQPEAVYSLLTNADLPWPTIEIGGAKVTLDQEGYVAHRTDPDPAVRAKVFQAFYTALGGFQRSLGATLAAEVRDTAFVAKVRHYASALDYALDGDNVPEAVYRTMVHEADLGLPVLHRYLGDMRKLLGLPTLRYSDLYVPLAPPPRHYSLAEAEPLIVEAVKPLGPDYARDLKTGFLGGWAHTLPQRGKRSGAYENGEAYDVHPYVLLSYSGDLQSVSTLAHEFGHAMHSVLANRSQPFETANYSIFVAEIPSTTNEMLLADHVAATAKTRPERIYALSRELELLRTTFFRQAMFAEFEAAIHDAEQRGQALTGEDLTRIYLGILRNYMGDAQGVVKVDDLYGVEWAYIPHFYTDFYVYQYATSISGAAYFADGIERGDSAVRTRYFDMLKAGGSDDPYRIVQHAGLDMATPVPYRALVARMSRLLDELEAAMAEKG